MIRTPSIPFSARSFLCIASAIAMTCALSDNQAQALATWIGSWDYVLRNDNEGKPQAAFARLRGDSDALLWLTCARLPTGIDKPETISMTATVSQKSYLGWSSPRGRSTVFWFDNGSPELGYWTYRDKLGQISSSEQVDTFLSRLAEARSLVVELSNYRYETRRSEFQLNISDTKAVADRFRQDCRNIANYASTDVSFAR